MNSIIKQELEKCKDILPEFDDKTTYLLIPKGSNYQEKKDIQLEIGRYYLIKLARYILYPPDNFTLDSNWNNGVHPQSEYMMVTPIKFVGKMIQFDGCGYDKIEDVATADIYNGLWLPSGGIEILEEVM